MTGFIKFIKVILSPLLLPLVIAFVIEAFLFLTTDIVWLDIAWMLAGLVGYFVFYVVLNGNNLRFIETFEHELNHAVTAMLSLNTISSFHVDGKLLSEKPEDSKALIYTGEVGHGPTGCFLITLAPYFLPVITIPLLLIHPFTPDPFIPVIDALIGFTLGFHYAALLKEFGAHQTDIQKNSLPFSFLTTVFFNTVILVLVISVVVNNFRLTFDYLRDAVARSLAYYGAIVAWIQQLGIPAMVQDVVRRLTA